MALAPRRRARARSDPTARTSPALVAAGPAAAARKVGEEGVEVALAGASESDERLVEEVADLWFHSYVLLAARGLDPSLVEDELVAASYTVIDDLAARVALAHVLERVGDPLERIRAVDHRCQLPGLDEVSQRLHVRLVELRQEERRPLASAERSEP